MLNFYLHCWEARFRLSNDIIINYKKYKLKSL